MIDTLPIFGKISGGGTYDALHTTPDGQVLEITLFADGEITTEALSDIKYNLLNIDHLVTESKDKLRSTCSNGGQYEDDMRDYMEYVLFECKLYDRNAYSSKFEKKYSDITPDDFLKYLELRGIAISFAFKSIALDYKFDKNIDEIWCVHYDLKQNMTLMNCES